MCPHPVICVQKMCLSIFFRLACKFRLKMAPIDHLLMYYLRGWLMQKRLRLIWDRLEGTSGVCWNRLIWRGLLWCRLIWRRLLRSRLVGWLIWRVIMGCIWRTSRGIIVIVLVRLVSIAICVINGIFRG